MQSSPTNSQVFPSFDYSLSPPPTPIAKRARQFLPSNTASSPVPMFFSKSRSLFGPESIGRANNAHHYLSPEEAMEKKQLQVFASRPAPDVLLKPRPTVTSTTHWESSPRPTVAMDKILAPPFTSSGATFRPVSDDVESSIIPELPWLSSNNSSTSKRLEPKKPEQYTFGRQAKLPSFQRGGMRRHIERRRSSFVARSA